MHNLHFAVIRSESAEDACNTVECFIEDFGNENNWRSISGAVSEHNEVYLTGEGRFAPDETSDTIEKINAMVTKWMQPDTFYEEPAKKVMKLVLEGNDPEDTLDWYRLEKYAADRYAEAMSKKIAKGEPFNVLEHEFKDYQYDDCGVTQLDYDDGETAYVVFIDMHS